MDPTHARPLDVVIVGAPRSGTNMLRDVLTSLPGVATWPCDEINLVWRHGNRSEPSDELTVEQARPAVASYVRTQFEKVRGRYDTPVVVEKTCATSLRVEFTRTVLPDAKYVFITRDGIDAAASSIGRWHAPFDLRYTAAKARFVPPSDLPYYGARFVATQVRRRASRTGQASSGQVTSWWGPKPRDWREIMRSHPLDEVCALQWQRCVDASRRGLAGLPDDQLHVVAYEDFVGDPVGRTGEIVRFLGLPDADVSGAVAGVSARSVGKGRATLGPEAVSRLEALVGPSLGEPGDGA